MSDQSQLAASGQLGGEVPHGSIGVTRKVNLGNYESEEVTVWVPFDVTGNEDVDAVSISDAAFLAKSAVYSQLGLPVELQDGVLRVTGAFPGATVQQAQPVAVPPQSPIPAQGAPSAAPAASGEPVCPLCQGGMYDNRAKNVERLAAGQKALPEARCRNHADPPKGTGCPGILWNIAKGK